jgi:VanZ family protein
MTTDPESLAQVHFYIRKVLHVVCYGVLTVLWLRALMATYPERVWTNRILALVLCLMVALTDEGRQYLFPDRTASWWDVGLDTSGGLLFLFLSACYFKKNMTTSAEGEPPSSCHPSSLPSGLQSQKRRFIFKK